MSRGAKVALAVGMTSALLAACGIGTGSGGSGKSLTFVSYGKGAYQDGQVEAWLRPFELREDVRFAIDSPSDNTKLKAMVEAGNVSWDVVDTDLYMARENCGTLVEKIDIAGLESKFPEGTLSDCGVPSAFIGLVFMYNADKYGKNPPGKLADFFDIKKYPGKRVLHQDVTNGALEAALMADGVAPDRLYPLDVERALSVYDRIKQDLSFAQTFGQQQQIMVDNQADMALVVSSRAYSVLKAGGNQWKPVWDKVPVGWNVLAIPKGSRNKRLAQEFIRFASDPAHSARFAELAAVGAANADAEPRLNDKQRSVYALGADHADARVFLDPNWWVKNRVRTVEKWTKWQVG